MTKLIEFEDESGILVELASGATDGIGAVGAKEVLKTTKVGRSFTQSLEMIREVGRAVRETLKDTGVDDAEVKIGFKASGTGQFIVAATTVEAAIEVTFKVRAEP